METPFTLVALLQLPRTSGVSTTGSAHVSFLSPPIESIVELPSCSSLASSLPPFPSSSFPASYTSSQLPRHLSSTAVSHQDFSLSPLHGARASPVYNHHRDSPNLSHRDSPLAHRDRDNLTRHSDSHRDHRDEVLDRSIHRDHYNPPPEPAPSFSPIPLHHQQQQHNNHPQFFPPSGPPGPPGPHPFPASFPPNTESIAAAIMSAAGAGGLAGIGRDQGLPGTGPGGPTSLPHPIPVPINGRTGQGGQPYKNVEDEAMILLKKQDLEAMLSTRQVAANAVMDKQYVRARLVSSSCSLLCSLVFLFGGS